MITLTIKALRHIRQIAQETSGEVVYALGRQPAVLRTFSQRLSRYVQDINFFRFYCLYWMFFILTHYYAHLEASMMLLVVSTMMVGLSWVGMALKM